jgi:hypothetical protein
MLRHLLKTSSKKEPTYDAASGQSHVEPSAMMMYNFLQTSPAYFVLSTASPSIWGKLQIGGVFGLIGMGRETV